jgi:hypothetical protein
MRRFNIQPDRTDPALAAFRTNDRSRNTVPACLFPAQPPCFYFQLSAHRFYRGMGNYGVH